MMEGFMNNPCMLSATEAAAAVAGDLPEAGPHQAVA